MTISITNDAIRLGAIHTGDWTYDVTIYRTGKDRNPMVARRHTLAEAKQFAADVTGTELRYVSTATRGPDDTIYAFTGKDTERYSDTAQYKPERGI